MKRNHANHIWLLGILFLLLGGFSLAPANTHAYLNSQTEGATLTLTPTTVIPNQTIVVTGKNFTWGKDVTIETITIDNEVLPSSNISSGTQVNVDSSGTFIATVLVPINSNTLNPGTRKVKAVDSLGRQATASFTVAAPTISISPVDSSVGSTVTVTGSGFPVSSGRIGADLSPLVDIEYKIENGISRTLVTAQPDTKGAFTVTFKVPLKTPVPSDNNEVRASIPNTGFIAKIKHTVPKSDFTVTPASGAPGTQVTVTGSSYKAFVPISSVKISGIPVLTDQTMYTDGDGSLSIKFVVPALENGTFPISVVAGSTSRITTFTVTDGVTSDPETMEAGPVGGPPRTQWLPARYSAFLSLRPLRNNLTRVFHFDNTTKQWSFYDPQPEFAEVNTLTELVQRQGYWIRVKWDETILLGDKRRELYRGWNLIAW
ncbi:MAG: IPT/TIG domain-containing protein [Dehalococcoidia bacterium]